MISEIRKYYLEYKVNFNNKDAFNSWEIRNRIFKLRQKIRNKFNWKDMVSFLPNEYIARTLLRSNGIEEVCVVYGIKDMSSEYCFIINAIQGVTIICYKKPLIPYYVSNTSIDRTENGMLIYSKKEEAIECGTLNTPLLLALETYYD